MHVFGWLCLLVIIAALCLTTVVSLLWEGVHPGAVGWRGLLALVAVDAALIYVAWTKSPFTVTLTP